MFENKKVIIFDLDGTLIDSMSIWNISDQVLIKYYTGQIISEYLVQEQRDYVLRTTENPNIYAGYFHYLKEKYNILQSVDEIARKRKDISEHYIKEKVQFKDGAVDLLYKLKEKGYKLALATTTTKCCVDIYNTENPYTSIIDFNSIFDLILTVESVKYKKPHPEVHQTIMNYFKVNPKECLIFEDSIQGIEAGHGANIEVVGVYNTVDFDSDKVKKQAEYFVSSLKDVVC